MNITLKKPDGIRLLTGGKLCTEDITLTPLLEKRTVSENGTVRATEGYAGLSEVEVNVAAPAPSLEELNVTQNGTYAPAKDGFSVVTVAISEYDGTVTVDA